MRRTNDILLRLTLSAVAIALFLPAMSARAGARIEFELITERGFPITGAHEWTRFLADMKLDRIRIRSGTGSEQPAIETAGSASTPTYYVTGVLTTRNQLRLPGGTFSLRDKTRLKDWCQRLSQGGQEALDNNRAAFGLTARQLVAAHESLAAKVRVRTKGQPVESIVASIAREAVQQTAVDPAVMKSIAGDRLVPDEFKGLASGTSLAAVLRPLGLVFVPASSRGSDVLLRIVAAGKAPESWPVGWPPSTLKAKPIDLVPKLFERLEVEVTDTPLQEVLDAVQQRLSIPLLVDHQALARRKIDPAQALVSYAQPRSYYWRILDDTTRQAKLKVEVRVDEAGQPFLWLTTRQP